MSFEYWRSDCSGDSEFYNKVAFRGHRGRGADVIPGGEPLKAQITLSL